MSLAWLLAIIILPLVILALAVSSPGRVRIWVRGSGTSMDYAVWVRPALSPWYVRLPDIRRRKRPPAKSIESTDVGDEGQAGSGAAEPLSLETFANRFRSLAGEFRRLYPPMKAAILSLARAVRFERFRIFARVGTGDAYETAMLCGALNSVIGLALSIAGRCGVRFSARPVCRASPIFNEVRFEYEVNIEVSFSVAGVSRAAFGFRQAIYSARVARGRANSENRVRPISKRGILGPLRNM